MYDASVPVFVRMLGNLKGILQKAEAHATARKIDPNALLADRLYPDMFAFARQVQLSTDFAKGAGARLAGVEVPKYEDTEATFSDLSKRIDKTIGFLRGLKKESYEGSETREVTLSIGGQPTKFEGLNYLLNFALPNFYFHMTTAYDILRHNGVEIGKRDFIGPR
jgi:hypothetical protein